MEQRDVNSDREAGRQLKLNKAFQTREIGVSYGHQVNDGKDLILNRFG